MKAHTATVSWERGEGEAFTDLQFSRAHEWSFDGGLRVRASASPHVVPRYSDPSGIDPEEAFVASLSSCHMLTFLWLAAKAGRIVDRYEDAAEGELERTAEGRTWMARVTLHPWVTWGVPGAPDQETLAELHHRAHAECFIANSVRTDVRCEPVP